MSGRLQREIKQSKPFHSLEVEAFLNLVRTADELGREMSLVLKPHDLTATQYNVLRILRGAGDQGLPCGEISTRMVTHDPDITRLLDRLEKRRLTARSRGKTDRRVVMVKITQAGSDLLARVDLDATISGIHALQLGHLGKQKLTQLIGILENIRERADG